VAMDPAGPPGQTALWLMVPPVLEVLSVRAMNDATPSPSVTKDGFHLLDDVLAELEQAIPEQQPVLRGMRDQLSARQIRIVVLGEAKRGKSSLINALVGFDLLPTGVIPVTSVATVVRRASTDAVRVTYQGGRVEPVEMEEVAEYVSEDRNPGNRRGVESVEILVGDLPWEGSLAFVDTPGTGSVDELHDRVSATASNTMDVALFVLSSDPPVTARERRQIADAAARSAEILIVVTKSDLLTGPELETVLAYTREIARHAAGPDVAIIAVSAKNPDTEPHPGLLRLRRVIAQIATDPDHQVLGRSLRDRARRIALAERDEMAVSMSLVELERGQAADRARAFAAAVEEARAQHRDCGALVSAGVRSINNRLDESRASAARNLTGMLLQFVEDLDDRNRRESMGEAVAVQRMTNRATEFAEGWRRTSAEVVEDQLAVIGLRATASMEVAIAQLRESAHELLGVSLTLSIKPVALPVDSRFFYITTSESDVAAAMSNAVRQRLPRALRRRSTISHLRETAEVLADRQLGRARGDLRLRLSEAERILLAQVESHTGEVLSRLERAATSAAALALQHGPRRQEALTVMADRRDRLDSVIRRLEEDPE
jgi:signal recognition particle receptor subunit beta